MQNIPPNVQHEITQFQQLEQQYQMMVSQLQATSSEMKEIEDTLKEMENIKDDEIYKSVGSVLFKSDKETVEKGLKERKETLELRKTTLERQENRLRQKLQDSQKKIQELLGTGGPTPNQGS
ncbi:MAG: prefoldin subunit beta [Candidatus Methanofastidiosa archaeon]|nr:prefoldin subunit beta [Candidatus Methanofastidiosa archaeon]